MLLCIQSQEIFHQNNSKEPITVLFSYNREMAPNTVHTLVLLDLKIHFSNQLILLAYFYSWTQNKQTAERKEFLGYAHCWSQGQNLF